MLGLWDWNIKRENIINVKTISLFLDSVIVKAVAIFWRYQGSSILLGCYIKLNHKGNIIVI